MENKQSLFREEVQHSRLNRSLGTMRVNVPINFKITASVSSVLLIAIFLFLSCAQIADKNYVRGYLDTETGIVTMQTSSSGIISQALVEEGKQVRKGDLLFVVANPDQKNNQLLMNNVRQRVDNLNREYQLKKEHYRALAQLNKKQFISNASLKESETELLEVQNRIRFEESEYIKYQQNDLQMIRSPIDGTITNIFYKQGQIIDASKSLVQIIPKESKLIVKLFIPSRSMAFLKKEQQIILKYDAYPSQRFGSYKAFIKEINLTVLTDDKEDKPLKVGEPYYRIKAELENSFVKLYGKEKALSHGMTLTAVVSADNKKIWQWILDPIFSYYGDRFS